jgi:hypothetical protein
MAGRPCKVCQHRNRAAIDRQLAQGTATRTLAAEYNLSKAAVARHKINCAGVITPTLEERREPSRATVHSARLPERDEIGAMLLGLHSRLDAIAARCEDEGASALSISALDKMRLQLQDVARLQGFSGTGPDRSVHVNVGVNVSAQDIGASIAQHLSGLSLEPLKLVEAIADEP